LHRNVPSVEVEEAHRLGGNADVCDISNVGGRVCPRAARIIDSIISPQAGAATLKLVPRTTASGA